MKRHAPATERNRNAIGRVLREELPAAGSVLEIASGSGEHAVFFARTFPHLVWMPTDVESEALLSITAWAQESGLTNIDLPRQLDATCADWAIEQVDAVYCCNMIHISPWAAANGLFRGASKVLAAGAPLVIYGPFLEEGRPTAPSNAEFDASLKSRNPDWGLRQVSALDELAHTTGLRRTGRYELPANNLVLVYRPDSSLR